MAESTKDSNWWDSLNEGIKIAGGVYANVKAQKKKSDAVGVSPKPTAYPSKSKPGIFVFGDGEYGGFSGLQLGLVAVVLVGLFFVIKVIKK